MTRKDYVAAAALIMRLAADPTVPAAVTLEVMGVLSDLFASDNPRFDREKFVAACMKEAHA